MLALIIKSSPIHFYSATNVLGHNTEWQVTQEEATKAAGKIPEVKRVLRQGETRQETPTGVKIDQPELILKSPPSPQSPYWTFELVRRTIIIPKTGKPTEEIENLLNILIDPFTGRVI